MRPTSCVLGGITLTFIGMSMFFIALEYSNNPDRIIDYTITFDNHICVYRIVCDGCDVSDYLTYHFNDECDYWMIDSVYTTVVFIGMICAGITIICFYAAYSKSRPITPFDHQLYEQESELV